MEDLRRLKNGEIPDPEIMYSDDEYETDEDSGYDTDEY